MNENNSICKQASVIQQGLTKQPTRIWINNRKRKQWKTVLAGLLICCVLCAPLTTIVQSTQIKDVLEKNRKLSLSTINSDSEIFLTKKELPLLKQAVKNIEDVRYRMFTQQIIDIIEEKGIFDNNDSDSILAGTNVTIKIGCIIQGFCGGRAFCFRHALRNTLWARLGVDFFHRGGILHWFTQSTYSGGFVQVGSERYNTGKGTAIGYYGIVKMYMEGWPSFKVDGWALLTFVSP